MKTLLFLLSGPAAIAVASIAYGSSGHTVGARYAVHTHSPSVTGVVIGIHSQQARQIFDLHVAGGHLVNVSLTKGRHLTTVNGHALLASDVRLGDRLTVSSKGDIEDTSQKTVNLRGIVSVAPLVASSPLTVQVSSAWSIVVDTGSKTRYMDASHETSNVAEIQDADEVQLQGIYDVAVGEMAETTSIARIGPYHRKQHQASKP
jgi:hypothetical protein